MKKVVLILISAMLFVVLLVSCNKSICPAYVIDDKAVQVENNG